MNLQEATTSPEKSPPAVLIQQEGEEEGGWVEDEEQRVCLCVRGVRLLKPSSWVSMEGSMGDGGE